MRSHEFVQIRFPAFGVTMRARICWDENMEACELFLKNLPIETIYSHMTASGQALMAPIRIVENVSQSKYTLLTELPRGSLCMDTSVYKSLDLYYGDVTEPLPAARIAQVVEEDLADLARVGREVWISNYMTHKPVNAIFEIVS